VKRRSPVFQQDDEQIFLHILNEYRIKAICQFPDINGLTRMDVAMDSGLETLPNLPAVHQIQKKASRVIQGSASTT
jgi:hypothetical protein